MAVLNAFCFFPASIDKVTASLSDGFLRIRPGKLGQNKTHNIPITEG